jgi:O-antigen ligase
MSMGKSTIKPPRRTSVSEPVEIVQAPWGPVLTQAAFVLTLALVAARALMPEVLRDATTILPGASLAPRSAQAATSLVLDLLCCLPALLVLVRRVIEKDYLIQLRISHLLIGAFALWAALSTIWATDQYAALVTATHILAAAVVIWSTTQLVRSWLRLRIVAGICFGLLLAYLAHGFIYRFVDSADNLRYWQEHRAQILQEHGWTADSFEAKQFIKNIESREILGFNQSPNSFAAVIVLLVVIGAGAGIQRRLDGAGWGPAAIVAATVPLALAMFWFTGTRTAVGTIIIAALIFAGVRALGPWLRRRPARAYIAGLSLVLLVIAAVIGHGIYHGSLPGASLTFRWRYWVAASRIFDQHPWLGVGWSNFGQWYTSVRLPIAAEEIRDPHNFIVRAFSEVGVVGGGLLLLWLARVAWELTRPVAPPSSARSSSQARQALRTIALAAVGAIVINAVASIDWSQASAFLLLESFRRLLFLGLLIIGALIVTVRSFKDPRLEDRPGPWVLYGMLAALAVFFVHSMVDFVLAEPGPLMLFAMLIGAAMGVRTRWVGTSQSRRGAIAALSVGAVVWIAAMLVWVLPVADASEVAQLGDAMLAAGDPAQAATHYRGAFQRMPLDADYAFDAARAMVYANADRPHVKVLLDVAIARDPREPRYYIMRAHVEDEQGDSAGAKSDYQKALALDPNNVEMRLEYAQMLEKINEPAAARRQYQIALQMNNLLAPDEPKRLPMKDVGEIRKRIQDLAK